MLDLSVLSDDFLLTRSVCDDLVITEQPRSCVIEYGQHLEREVTDLLVSMT
jgi:hypothetical protein